MSAFDGSKLLYFRTIFHSRIHRAWSLRAKSRTCFGPPRLIPARTSKKNVSASSHRADDMCACVFPNNGDIVGRRRRRCPTCARQLVIDVMENRRHVVVLMPKVSPLATAWTMSTDFFFPKPRRRTQSNKSKVAVVR